MRDKNENPRASNTGVTPYNRGDISWTLDWLQGTFKRTHLTIPVILKSNPEESKPRNGYTQAERHDNGMVIMHAPGRPEMGYHVVMTGDTLRNIDQQTAMNWLSTADRITRIDFAVDIRNRGWDVEKFRDAFRLDEITCSSRSVSNWDDWTDRGQTVYFGRKTSDRMTKFYDKAKEQKEDGDWWRAETTFRGRHAMQALKSLKSGETTATALIRGHVDINQKWYRDVMSEEPFFTIAGKPKSNTKEWLMSQCAPALAKIIEQEKDHGFWLDFQARVFALAGE